MKTRTPVQELPQTAWQRPFVKAHRKWCDDFAVELRLRDVAGPVIGERLAEVEGHCAETGETPSEAFGDPTDYARTIDEDSSPERVSGVWKMAALSSAQVLALFVGTAAVRAWSQDGPLTFNAVQVVCLGLFVLLLLLLPKLLRPLVQHPWTFGLPLVVLALIGSVGAALSGRTGRAAVAQLPAPALAIGLLGLVLLLAFVGYRELARDASGDLVTSPLTLTTGQQKSTASSRRLSALLPALLVPAAYIALATLMWVL